MSESDATKNAQAAAQPVNGEEQEQNIVKTVLTVFWTYVFPYLWLYAASVLLFLIGAFFYLHTAVPLYKSTASIFVNNTRARIVRLDGIQDPTFMSNNFMNTQIMLMTGKENIGKTYEKLGLNADKQAMIGEIHASVLKDSNVIALSVVSTSADLAEQVANGLIKSYKALLLDRKENIANSGVEVLRSQLDDITKRHDDAVKAMLAYKKENGIYNFTSSYNQLLNRVNELHDAMMHNEANAEEIQSLMADIEEHREDAAVMLPVLLSGHNMTTGGGNTAATTPVVGASNLAALQQLELQHEMTLPDLLARYGSNSLSLQIHSKVKKMIADAQEREINVSLSGLRLSREMILKHNNLIQEQIEEGEKRLTLMDQMSGDFHQREAAVEELSRTMEMLVKRINEVRIADASDQLTDFAVFIVDTAVKAGAPFFPQPKMVFGKAIIMGLALAGLISFLLVMLNTELTDSITLNNIFGGKLTDFGKIPSFFVEEKPASKDGKKDDETLKEEIEVKKRMQSDLDDVFREIRTSLNLSIATRNTKVLAVTSAAAGEGKTFFCCNLARSYAQSGKKVLLIDADLRKPSVTKFFEGKLAKDAGKQCGLSNILVGDCTMKDATLHIDTDNIDVVPVGPLPPNPNELLTGSKLGELINEAKSAYDIVIFDTSPVGLVPDALLIINQNVPFLLIARLFCTSKNVLQTLAQRLRQLNVQPVGFITNYADAPSTTYGYGQGKYGKYGKYGYGKYGYGKYGYGKYGYGKYGYGETAADAIGKSASPKETKGKK